MVDEKLTEVEETEETTIGETETVEEVEETVEEFAAEQCCENDILSDEDTIPTMFLNPEILTEQKKTGKKGLVVNAVLTGIMLVALVVSSFFVYKNTEKIKALETELTDVKDVLGLALTGDAYTEFDFAETAKQVREERKMIEEYMKEMEKQQAPAEESEAETKE